MNFTFKGAEKLLFNSAMRLPSSAIKQMGKEAAKKGFAAGSLDGVKKILGANSQEALEETRLSHRIRS